MGLGGERGNMRDREVGVSFCFGSLVLLSISVLILCPCFLGICDLSSVFCVCCVLCVSCCVVLWLLSICLFGFGHIAASMSGCSQRYVSASQFLTTLRWSWFWSEEFSLETLAGHHGLLLPTPSSRCCCFEAMSFFSPFHSHSRLRSIHALFLYLVHNVFFFCSLCSLYFEILKFFWWFFFLSVIFVMWLKRDGEFFVVFPAF